MDMITNCKGQLLKVDLINKLCIPNCVFRLWLSRVLGPELLSFGAPGQRRFFDQKQSLFILVRMRISFVLGVLEFRPKDLWRYLFIYYNCHLNPHLVSSTTCHLYSGILSIVPDTFFFPFTYPHTFLVQYDLYICGFCGSGEKAP